MSESSGLTHALMNHLSVILGFSELLLQDLPSEDPRRVDLEEIHKAAAAAVRAVTDRGSIPPEPIALGEVEREHIIRILQESQGNKRLTAHRLGISRRTLYRRLARHGLMPGDKPGE